MQILSPSRIRELGEDPSRCTRAVDFDPIDFSRPFIPEEFTQLYYTPLYSDLDRRQRLRYNQLFGVKVNEQVAVFEEDFSDRLLGRLAHHPSVAAQPDLQVCLQRMIDEERHHSRMFHDLNRLCLPEVYGDRDRHFLRMGRPDRVAFALLTAAPYLLTFPLWFTTAMEEYSVGLSRIYIKNHETETLGPLERNFVRIHSEHAKDETRHVHTALNLIDTCQAGGGKVRRRINAALFRQLIRNIVVPRRGGAAVIRRLLEDRPELQPEGERMIRAVRDLEYDERFQKSLFNRKLMPCTFHHLDNQPEFERLGEVMLGYDRRRVAP